MSDVGAHNHGIDSAIFTKKLFTLSLGKSMVDSSELHVDLHGQVCLEVVCVDSWVVELVDGRAHSQDTNLRITKSLYPRIDRGVVAEQDHKREPDFCLSHVIEMFLQILIERQARPDLNGFFEAGTGIVKPHSMKLASPISAPWCEFISTECKHSIVLYENNLNLRARLRDGEANFFKIPRSPLCAYINLLLCLSLGVLDAKCW